VTSYDAAYNPDLTELCLDLDLIMNRFVRPLCRVATLHSRSLPPRFYFQRAVATSVSGRPASQTVEHAALNVKEEVGNSAADLAKKIAGGYLTSDAVAPAGKTQTFVSFKAIASTIRTDLPAIVAWDNGISCLSRPKTVLVFRPRW